MIINQIQYDCKTGEKIIEQVEVENVPIECNPETLDKKVELLQKESQSLSQKHNEQALDISATQEAVDFLVFQTMSNK